MKIISQESVLMVKTVAETEIPENLSDSPKSPDLFVGFVRVLTRVSIIEGNSIVTTYDMPVSHEIGPS